MEGAMKADAKPSPVFPKIINDMAMLVEERHKLILEIHNKLSRISPVPSLPSTGPREARDNDSDDSFKSGLRNLHQMSKDQNEDLRCILEYLEGLV